MSASLASLPFYTPPFDDQFADDEASSLEALIFANGLHAVFQPILDFQGRRYIGFEALIRGPAHSHFHAPQELFAAASRHGLTQSLERACRQRIFSDFSRSGLPGKLFINSSLGGLNDPVFRNGGTLAQLCEHGLSPSRIVIELTENQRINDFPNIRDTLLHYRQLGYQIAIDDLGEGFANMRMWSEVRPEYVKIDRHFIHGIADDKLKFHFVKAMQDLAETCAAQIIAEGIERESDCLTVRDLGIACGQGYLIARPETRPSATPPAAILDTLNRQDIMVFPATAHTTNGITVSKLVKATQPLSSCDDNETAYRRFEHDSTLHALPVVDHGKPVGLINRSALIDRYARPFRRELFGRKSCTQFMDSLPLIVDHTTSVQDAGLLISRSASHHIYDGFIIVRDGDYLGTGSCHDLIAIITEMQISAARYANPLTQLPGNVPINEHIDRLLEHGVAFTACYFDINAFKPYNDAYGYRRGDDIIQLLGQVLSEIAGEHVDFVGHIGGDDFMILFQSNDWESRCKQSLECFSERVAYFLRPEDLANGGYTGENRRGEAVFHHNPSLAIGAVPVEPGQFESHREISAAAAEAKKNAKKVVGNNLFIERRQFTPK